MNESRAAVRYAKAILDLAADKRVTDAVEKDMRSIVTTVSDSKELRQMLASPVITGTAKKDILSKIFKNSHAISEGLIALLVENKRISILNEVALKYIIINEQLKGKDVAYVTTAVPMDATMEKKILKQVTAITGNEVTLENTVDENIIGGFVLRVGDLQYDASIANKLNNLKREFTNNL
ncbi:MAG: F-type H+-transporting ATPase subunit delta [Maribacter sp.]|jgi:F-type H+-transporting ATPase subunit delta